MTARIDWSTLFTVGDQKPGENANTGKYTVGASETMCGRGIAKREAGLQSILLVYPR